MEQTTQLKPVWKFEKVGDVLSGSLTYVGHVQDKLYGTDMLAFWDDGSPRLTLVIGVETAKGEVRAYLKPTARKALTAAAKGIPVVGGTVRIERTEDLPPRQEGYAPQHQFSAEYEG